MAFVAEKMDKQTRLNIRRARDRKRKEEIRQDQLMINYIKVKYPVIYGESRDYFSTLNTLYPTRHDLRKTWLFKQFKTNTKSCDNMVLEIPLMNHKTNEDKETINHEDKETPNHEAKDHEAKETTYVDDIFPDIDPTTLLPELSPQFIEEIIKDLRADPDLAALMNDVEDQMEYEDVADDLDIDIQADLLEKELVW